MEQPRRIGEQWTIGEEQRMLKRLSTGAGPNEIAEELERTIGAIVCRQKHIARKLVRSGKSIEEVSKIVNLSPLIIRQSVDASDRQITKKTDEIKKLASNSAEETLLSVCVEIRNLLRQLINQNKFSHTLNTIPNEHNQ